MQDCFIPFKLKPSISFTHLWAGYFHSKVRRKSNFPIKKEPEIVHTSVDILKFLIENGGDIQIKDGDGKTPYDYAKEMRLKDNMELLKP